MAAFIWGCQSEGALGGRQRRAVVVVALSVFILMAINTMAGVRGIDRVYLMAGRNYGANGWQMLRHVILPGAGHLVEGMSDLDSCYDPAIVAFLDSADTAVDLECIDSMRPPGFVVE